MSFRFQFQNKLLRVRDAMLIFVLSFSEVDNNPDYDDINQREIDEQEKYFDSESPQEAEYYGVQSGGNELDQLYQDFNQEIKSEKLTNEFKHMNTREKSTSNNDSL